MAQQKERTELQRLIPYYYAYRHGGSCAVDAHREARRLLVETNTMAETSVVSGTIMRDLLPLVVSTCIIVMALKSIVGYVKDGLWITSPSGRTTIELPLKLALRIIRKRKWRFAKVAPVKPDRVVSRHEALKVLLFGDE